MITARRATRGPDSDDRRDTRKRTEERHRALPSGAALVANTKPEERAIPDRDRARIVEEPGGRT
jgi:hypothetical protein